MEGIIEPHHTIHHDAHIFPPSPSALLVGGVNIALCALLINLAAVAWPCHHMLMLKETALTPAF